MRLQEAVLKTANGMKQEIIDLMRLFGFERNAKDWNWHDTETGKSFYLRMNSKYDCALHIRSIIRVKAQDSLKERIQNLPVV